MKTTFTRGRILLAAMLLTASGLYGQSLDITLGGAAGTESPPSSIALSGSHAYVVNESAITLFDRPTRQVFDVADVTQPGDPIIAFGGDTASGEDATKAIDGQASTKYFNFGKVNTGFTITPWVGATVVVGLGLTSANDCPERDPASYRLDGSHSGQTYVEIASGTVPAFAGRFATWKVFFTNETAYEVYRLIFPTVANTTTAIAMQIAEVELFGTVAPATYNLTLSAGAGGAIEASPSSADGRYAGGTVVTLTAKPNANYQFDSWGGDASGTNPTIQVTMSADRTVTANFASGYLDIIRPGDPIIALGGDSSPGEDVSKAIDGQTSTKYFNAGKVNTGFTITPWVGATVVVGLGLTSANDCPERDPASYRLEGSHDGQTYVEIASGTVPAIAGRFATWKVFFANETAYEVYRLIFPTVANATTAIAMQIAEVELFGTVVGPVHVDPETQEFAFSDLTVRVVDSGGTAVMDAEVRAYHSEWYLAFPESNSAHTGADGTCVIRVPQGLYRIVVGGGAPYNSPGSGRGLFLTATVRVQGDTQISLQPEASAEWSFLDRLDQPIDADTLYAAPQDMVPNCQMPRLGATRTGRCQVEYGPRQSLAVFFLRSPTALTDGYYVFFDHVDPALTSTLRMSTQPLRAVQFEGHGPDNQLGPAEWAFGFPYQDYDRHWWHTSFTVTGKATAWFSMDYFDYCPRFRLWDTNRQDYICYYFQYQGVDLLTRSNVLLRAGGPLSRGFKYVPIPFDRNRSQVLLGPTLDAYGNELRYYAPENSQTPRFSHPFQVQDAANGKVLYNQTLDVTSDNLGFQLSTQFPTSSVFRLEWDLGPYGGAQTVEGRLGDPAYLWQYYDINRTRCLVHAPAWAATKGEQVADRWDQAIACMTALLESTPKTTTERNFYIHPVGIWASSDGQELYYHGFTWWNPRTPWAWNAHAFHEMGHRLVSEAFGWPSGAQTLAGNENEAVAELLSHSTLQALHGDAFAIPEWAERARRFFSYLAAPANPPNPAWHNLLFFHEVYIPRRFGTNCAKVFFRNWTSCAQGLSPLGYRQEEICAALYSAICRTNLAWAWRLSGQNVTAERVNEALRRMVLVETLPQSQTASLEGSVSFAVGVWGAPIQLQWKHNGVALPGQTNAVLELKPGRPEDAGDYSVEVRNDTMHLETKPVSLTLILPKYTLGLAVNPPQGGVIVPSPAPDGQGQYASMQVVTLTAVPAAGYGFTGWSGALSGTANPVTLTVQGNLTATANFAPGYLDITQPGDLIIALGGSSPSNEDVSKAIDDQTNSKYFNFGKLNTGFTITPRVGATAVTGLGLTSANDCPERDPASYRLEGSHNGQTYVEIASGTVPAFAGRFATWKIFFPNETAYEVYRVIFPTVANTATAIAMQIAEVELFGSVAPQTTPHLITAYAKGVLTLSWDGSGFVLDSTESLRAPVQWTAVSGVVGKRWETRCEFGSRFYRLRQ